MQTKPVFSQIFNVKLEPYISPCRTCIMFIVPISILMFWTLHLDIDSNLNNIDEDDAKY